MIYGVNASKASEKGWTWDNEVQYTTSRDLIWKEVRNLVKTGTWVEIRTPGYRSAPTVLIEANPEHLKIDKPVDWKEAQEVVLSYRRKDQPWNFLKSKLLRTEDKILVLDFPALWAILERREYFRIQCPTGSIAKCIAQKGDLIKAAVKDVSLEGLGLELPLQKGERPPRNREILEVISVALKLTESNKTLYLDIKKGGEIRRIQSPGRYSKQVYRLGIKLFTDEAEREILSKYIHKRELELLKVLKENE